jgi:hypothetical protein
MITIAHNTPNTQEISNENPYQIYPEKNQNIFKKDEYKSYDIFDKQTTRTQIPGDSVNAYQVWMLLLSYHPEADIDPLNLADHFGISKTKIYKLLNILIADGRVQRNRIREKGYNQKSDYMVFEDPEEWRTIIFFSYHQTFNPTYFANTENNNSAYSAFAENNHARKPANNTKFANANCTSFLDSSNNIYNNNNSDKNIVSASPMPDPAVVVEPKKIISKPKEPETPKHKITEVGEKIPPELKEKLTPEQKQDIKETLFRWQSEYEVDRMLEITIAAIKYKPDNLGGLLNDALKNNYIPKPKPKEKNKYDPPEHVYTPPPPLDPWYIEQARRIEKSYKDNAVPIKSEEQQENAKFIQGMGTAARLRAKLKQPDIDPKYRGRGHGRVPMTDKEKQERKAIEQELEKRRIEKL